MFSNSLYKCDRYSKRFNVTFFISKFDNNVLYDQNLIKPEEMKKNLFESILDIGNNEYIENENSGIEFSYKVSTISLKSEPHELGKAITEIVESADRYYYM
ncbi:3433_t:CDS:2 [Dentiscutata heterogama]|uniref:3433_t:CDS:1 n=1 Tax=Dentiscutata heterogama TaxID=1316150 RepID=A0ACA9K715_9GLOM|nr:3433_t:CDS:2 [Dentiscutata heterogama]